MSGPDRSRARPSWLAGYGVLSLVIVVGIGVVLGVVLQDSISRRAVADAARTGEVAANVGVRPFLHPGELQRDAAPLPPERVDALDESLSANLSPNGIVRVEVRNRQHRLVYSQQITDPREPEERDERGVAELFAVHVPIRVDGEGRYTSAEDAETIGAVEVHLSFAPIEADITADTRRLRTALGVGLAVLYLAIYGLVAGVSRRLHRQSEQNLHLASHDGLTGLLNREAFLAAIELRRNALDDDTGDLVLRLDLDNFQLVNDTLGHEVGDRLLSKVGARLLSRAREGDVVARLGGDEFALLLCDAGRRQAVDLIDRFRGVLHEPIELAGVRLEVRASVGAVSTDVHMEAGLALQRADMAMCAAKADNTELEFFRPELDQLSTEALELVSEVRAGIDGQQFELRYQPKYDLATGAVTGSEALVRWQHPDRGFVPPDRFMPAVEQLPIGRDLTNYVIARALADLAEWRRLGLSTRVSVNLSASDVNDPSLPDIVEAHLQRHDLPGSLLTVELTEGNLLTNEQRTISTLQRIRELGCGVSIDDFGTGYASIRYLINLPVTELKIDQSFIRDLAVDEQSARVVRHCIELAHSLGYTATAEGIETPEIESLLVELGCDVGQGYLKSEPVAVDELIRLVAGSEDAVSSHKIESPS